MQNGDSVEIIFGKNKGLHGTLLYTFKPSHHYIAEDERALTRLASVRVYLFDGVQQLTVPIEWVRPYFDRDAR